MPSLVIIDVVINVSERFYKFSKHLGNVIQLQGCSLKKSNDSFVLVINVIFVFIYVLQYTL